LPVKQNSSDYVHLNAIPPPASPLARLQEKNQPKQTEEQQRLQEQQLEEQVKLFFREFDLTGVAELAGGRTKIAGTVGD
jgi:hypothetical protein